MTYEEQQEVIRVCGKEFDKIDIPTFIRQRDEENDASQEKWAEEHGAYQDENGIWVV